jgi:hypothetical protein
MVMLIFFFFAGAKLFPTFKPDSSLSFRFVSMILQCTGGGIVSAFLDDVFIDLIFFHGF